MKILIVIVSIALLPFAAAAQNSEKGSGSVSRFGISLRTFENLNRNDAAAALNAWAVTIGREQKLPEKVKVTLFDSFEELRTIFLQGQLEAVTVSVEEFLSLKVRPDWIFLPSRASGFTVRYALIVHNSGGITAPSGLEMRKIVSYGGPLMTVAKKWLESILGDGARTGEELSTEGTPSKSILQVFFRQAPAALTTLEAFELACELNPQLRKDLRVVAVSQPFISSFFIFRPTFTGGSRERLEAAIMNLHSTPGGQQVLTVFQSSRMMKQPASALDGTIRFLTGFGPPAESPLRGARPWE